MNCPKCNAVISDNSKFCTHCGTKIEKIAAVTPGAGSAMICVRCGAPLKPGVKFCSKCGASQSVPPTRPAEPVQGAVQSVQPAQGAVQPAQYIPQGTPQQQSASQSTVLLAQGAPQPQSASHSTVLLSQEASQAQPAQPAAQPAAPMPPSTVKPQKPVKKSILPIVLAAVFVLLIAVTVGGYFVLTNVFGLDPVAMITGNDKDMEEDEDSEESEEEDEDSEDIPSIEDEQELEVEKKNDPALLDALDTQMEAVQQAFNEMSYWEATSAGNELINQYVTIAENNNLTEEAADKIRNAYTITSKSAIEYCKGIESQEFGSAAFEQVNATLDSVIDLASVLKEKGYAINSLEIVEYRDGVITRFKEAFIRQINEITEREQWSRDEAWAYAEQAYAVQKDGKAVLFGDDPDDPLRLRYAYCLAWITRKRCENGVADGSMTNEDAFNAAVAILSETDYNLLVLQDVISYGSAARKDVSKYQNAYNAIVDRLKEEQNLSIVNTGVNSATSVDIRKFWYFNDLDGKDAYKVDIYNGTTQATRDWIRNNIPYYIN